MALFIVPLFLGGAAYILQSMVNHHFLFQGAIASSVAHNPYPYPYFLVPETTMYYNYGYHLEMAFCSLLTPISLEDLSSRLYPLYTFFLLIYVTFSFCREFIKGKEISGLLLLLNTFCVVGFYSWSLELLIQGIPTAITLTGSSTLALTIFFVLVDKIYKIVEKNSVSFLDCFFVCFLFFVGSIARAAFPIVLGGGLFLLGITELFKTWKISSVRNLLIIGIVLGGAFALALVLVYGIFSPYSALGFQTFVPQNTHFMYATKLKQWICTLAPTLCAENYYFSYRVSAFIYLILGAGYLTIGFYYQIFKWIKSGVKRLELLLIYCAVVSFLVWNFSDAPGGSHYPFFHYYSIIVSMFGAGGTYLIFKDTIALKNKLFFTTLAGVSLLLLIVKSYETYSALKHPWNWNDLHFRTPPAYGQPPKSGTASRKVLDKLMTLAEQKENLIVVSLATREGGHVSNAHLLSINAPGLPCYHWAGMNYGFNLRSKAPARVGERMSNIIKTIEMGENTKILDDNILNSFKQTFPNKRILFLIDKEKRTHSNQLKDLGEVEDIKFIQYSPL